MMSFHISHVIKFVHIKDFYSVTRPIHPVLNLILTYIYQTNAAKVFHNWLFTQLKTQPNLLHEKLILSEL